MSKPIEDPIRIDNFVEKARELDWVENKRLDSLKQFYSCIESLAISEIKYYYNRRKNSRKVSGITRFFSWLFGSIGLIIPLIGGALGDDGNWLLPWGYVSIAVSGSLIAANSIFAGTIAHHRYTSAQLKLEKILTKAHIKWNHIISRLSDDSNQMKIDNAFDHMIHFISGFYSILDDETTTWGNDVQEALDNFAKQLPAQNSE